MSDDFEEIERLAETHDMVSATIAVTNNISDLARLRAIREAFANLLAQPLISPIPVEFIDAQIFMRHAWVSCATIVEARIVQVTAPHVVDPEEFIEAVDTISEERDVERRSQVIMPSVGSLIEQLASER